MPKRGDREFIYDIIEACKRIIRYTKDIGYKEFLENSEKQDAVIRNIEIIGEAVKRISDDLKNRYKELNAEDNGESYLSLNRHGIHPERILLENRALEVIGT